MKKSLFAVLTAIFMSSVVFAAGVETTFYNKLYQDDVIFTHDDVNDEDTKDFPALKNEMYAEISTNKVDAMVNGIFALDDYNGKNFGLAYTGYVEDWYIEFRPIEQITFAMHDGIFADGSYLPIWDDNISAGNIGSDGFTVVFRPDAFNKGLRLAATLDFEDEETKVNYLDNEDSDMDIGFGAIFTTELVQIGASVQNAINSDYRTIGVYLNLVDITEGLSIGTGYAHSENVVENSPIIGEDIVNLSFVYTTEKFDIVAEVAGNLDDDNSEFVDLDEGLLPYDLYTAATFGLSLTDALSGYVTGKVFMDNTDNGFENLYEAIVGLEYVLDDHNSFGVEFDYATCDGSYEIALPVYWRYDL